MGRRFLVTGGAGFIGSNFIRAVLKDDPGATVTNLDALTYAGVKTTVDELSSDARHQFVLGDIRDRDLMASLAEGHDVIVNFAAESHVDRSIEEPSVFLETNVVGTGVLLDAARRAGVRRFIHVSTDEVYGSLETGFAKETDRLRPSSPYSASKAGADLLALSYAATYDYPVVVTRCTNNYGPYQFPEKLIPLFITRLVAGQSVPVYGDGSNQRDWLFVEDHCSAISLLVDEGSPGHVYNIGGDAQLSNLDLTKMLIGALGRDETSIRYVTDRLGHDFRYAVDSSKIRSMGWMPQHDLGTGLEQTIGWYRSRTDWWKPLVS